MQTEQCLVNISGGSIPNEEIQAYINRGREKYANRLAGIDIRVDGEFVDLHYHLTPIPFQRIRRIIGYLVGTLDRFNDGKRAEESERTKHHL